MALMDRAIGRELWGPFAIALASFYGVLLLGISGFEVVRQAVALGLPPSLVFWTLLWRSPEALAYALPVATLAASLSTYSRLRVQGEAVAWRALGLGPWRVARPALMMALGVAFVAALCFAVAPECSHRIRIAWTQAQPVKPASGAEAVSLSEYEAGQLRRLVVLRPHADGFKDVMVVEMEAGQVRRLTHAAKAKREADAWRFEKGWQAEMGPDGLKATTRFSRLSQGLPSAAMHLESQARRPEEMGFMAARERLLALRQASKWGPQERAQAVLLHQRWALPVVAIAFALGGVAAGLGGAAAGLGRGMGGSTLAVFGFYLLLFFSSSAGAAGWLEAQWAAWLPTLLATALGCVALQRSA